MPPLEGGTTRGYVHDEALRVKTLSVLDRSGQQLET
jgi:hypothetical protein